ncbi:MAG: hypothetical protein ACFFFT_14565 [Candidatus Thorarchaeota archaeon]
MLLDKFREFPKNRVLYLITLAGFLIILLVEIFVFIPVEASVPGYGILDYEFAWTSYQVEIIFNIWGSSGIDEQVIAIYWDFLFIVGYVSLAFGLIVIAFRKSEGKLQKIGTIITITPFLTGFLDMIENLFLILMANTPTSVSDPFPLIASLSATLKFGFLFIGIIYFVITIISIVINKVRK